MNYYMYSSVVSVVEFSIFEVKLSIFFNFHPNIESWDRISGFPLHALKLWTNGAFNNYVDKKGWLGGQSNVFFCLRGVGGQSNVYIDIFPRDPL